MTELAQALPQTVYPVLLYRDAGRAIEFLTAAFGFEKHLVIPGEGRAIAHAELRLDDAFIMLGSTEPNSPLQPNGSTEAPYVVVGDVDAHCARARSAGARIAREPEDKEFGGRGYAAYDSDGRVWSFGTYRPGA